VNEPDGAGATRDEDGSADAVAAPAGTGEPPDGSSPSGDPPPAGSPRGDSKDPAPEDVVARLKDQLLRTAADYDNFRKRTRKDIEDAGRRGKEDAVRELLPVADNLERAIAAAETTQEVKAVVDGVKMVLKLLEDSLDRVGVTRVKSLGERFDPSVHDAIQQVETDDAVPGTIVQELVPGYRMGDKLVRAAMVAVARPKSKQA